MVNLKNTFIIIGVSRKVVNVEYDRTNEKWLKCEQNCYVKSYFTTRWLSICLYSKLNSSLVTILGH